MAVNIAPCAIPAGAQQLGRRGPTLRTALLEPGKALVLLGIKQRAQALL